jgi:hypothetical protein
MTGHPARELGALKAPQHASLAASLSFQAIAPFRPRVLVSPPAQARSQLEYIRSPAAQWFEDAALVCGRKGPQANAYTGWGPLLWRNLSAFSAKESVTERNLYATLARISRPRNGRCGRGEGAHFCASLAAVPCGAGAWPGCYAWFHRAVDLFARHSWMHTECAWTDQEAAMENSPGAEQCAFTDSVSTLFAVSLDRSGAHSMSRTLV